MTTPPVFIAPVAGAQPGTPVVLMDDEGRHAAGVMRCRPGERVDLVDGAGVRAEATVAEVLRDRSGLTAVVERVIVEAAPKPQVTLVQALAKGDRDERALEAAVECGVDAIIPWQAERSVARWKGDRRWVACVRAAVKQSRRAWVPPVADVMTTGVLAAHVRVVTQAGGTVLVLHEGASCGLGEAPLGDPVLVIVGPEGGIAPGELSALTEAGGRATRIGPHVMRTSTAGPVVVAWISQQTGRWDAALRPQPAETE